MKTQYKSDEAPSIKDAPKVAKAVQARLNKEAEKVKPKKESSKKSVPTLKELLAEAKELGLKGYSKLNKAKLGERISEAEEKAPKEKE